MLSEVFEEGVPAGVREPFSEAVDIRENHGERSRGHERMVRRRQPFMLVEIDRASS